MTFLKGGIFYKICKHCYLFRHGGLNYQPMMMMMLIKHKPGTLAFLDFLILKSCLTCLISSSKSIHPTQYPVVKTRINWIHFKFVYVKRCFCNHSLLD